MKNYTPPYVINTKILCLTTNITEELSKLKYAQTQVINPMLRKKNRIKTLAGTLEIEGNFLGEEKITALLDGQRVMGSVLELAEVEGAIQAYEGLEKYKYNEMDDLLKAHKTLMNGILTTAGSWRNSNVRVGEHIAPQSHLVPELMRELFEWLEHSDEHLLLKSCVFHYEFEFIHPFSDGNGRMGRLWQSVMLYTYNPLFSSLPTESIIRDNQDGYYKALEEATAMGESTPFIAFMLEMILEAIVKVGNKVGSKVGNLNENQIMIVQMMRENAKVSAKKLSQTVGISVRKIEENIAKLKKLEIIERLDGTRGYWKVK